MRIEQFEAMRLIRINKWFNRFLIVLAVFCLIFLIYVAIDTALTFAELDALSEQIARNMP